MAAKGSYLYLLSCDGIGLPLIGFASETNCRYLLHFPAISFKNLYNLDNHVIPRLQTSTSIRWPSKQLVKRHLPKCFPKHPRTQVIIDCTELNIDKRNAVHPLLKKSLGVITRATIHSNYLLESPLQEHLVSSLIFTLGEI